MVFCTITSHKYIGTYIDMQLKGNRYLWPARFLPFLVKSGVITYFK